MRDTERAGPSAEAPFTFQEAVKVFEMFILIRPHGVFRRLICWLYMNKMNWSYTGQRNDEMRGKKIV